MTIQAEIPKQEQEGGEDRGCVKCRYELIKQRMYDEDLGEYDTYGIRVRTESGEEIASVSDVSPNGSLVDKLCRECNERELSPLYLLGVIERNI